MGETKKLSYEELEAAANQLVQINNKMNQQLKEQDYGNFHQRMAYLFEIIRYHKDELFSKDFINNAVKEIESVLTLPEQKE